MGALIIGRDPKVLVHVRPARYTLNLATFAGLAVAERLLLINAWDVEAGPPAPADKTRSVPTSSENHGGASEN